MKQERKIIWIFENDAGARLIYDEILLSQYRIRFFESIESFVHFSRGDETPHLILADLALADGNFLDYLGQSNSNRSLYLRCPLFIVSTCDDLAVLRSCFKAGALDCFIKPFSKNELLLKIERILLPPLVEKKENEELGEIILDIERLQIRTTSGVEVAQLTIKELQIFLALQRKRVLGISRQQLQELVWGNTAVGVKTLDVHLFNIRKKIQKLGLRIEYTLPDGFRLLNNGAE